MVDKTSESVAAFVRFGCGVSHRD